MLNEKEDINFSYAQSKLGMEPAWKGKVVLID